MSMDTQPELIDFFSEDNVYIKTGYFYNLTQLETIKYRKIFSQSERLLYEQLGSSAFKQTTREIV